MGVLDTGYVRLVNVMGTDRDVVNAARVSYDKETLVMDDKDIKLLNFLVEHKHDSCFRHCVMTFEVYAPLMIARQWYKHAVASTHLDDQMGWNESSRRYVTENEEFYVPHVDEWRAAPDNKKQGSGVPVDKYTGAKYTRKMQKLVEASHALYREALADGLAPEQARLILPAYSMYVRWRWTGSLNSILNFLDLRLKDGAQSEIREYADLVADEVEQCFPYTYKAWRTHRGGN